MLKFAAAALASAMVFTMPASAVNITYGLPGETTTTLNGTFVVEDFNALAVGFKTTLNSVVGTYANVYVNGGDVYGGAGGSAYGAGYGFDLFGAGSANPTYTLTLPTPKNYFGLYITAADDGDTSNKLKFQTSTGVVNYSTADFFNSPTIVQSAYTTNTSAGTLYSFFVNFDFGSETYSKVDFTAEPGTGFESDNHTVGSVPEPLTWGMMVVGFGAMGAAMRRRRPVDAPAF